MKKLVFLFVAFVAVSFASCGNKASNTESTVDSTVVEEAAPVVDDSTAVDSTAAVETDSATVAE